MTYESLLSDLRVVFDWFSVILKQFINSVSVKPIVMLALFVLIAIPSLYLLFDFILSLSDSGEDITAEGFRIYKQFRKHDINFKQKETRKAFHKTKKSFNQDKLRASIAKWDKVPLSKNYINPTAYNVINNFNRVNSSSPSHQGSRANIDVEVDDD